MYKHLFKDARHSKSNFVDDNESVGNQSAEDKDVTRFKLLDKLETHGKSRQVKGFKSLQAYG
jgi:hypothetical protein